jgi:hypothetical protein
MAWTVPLLLAVLKVKTTWRLLNALGLNRAQGHIIWTGLAFLAFQGLFPPWKLTFSGGTLAPTGWPEGFGFILLPPPPSPNAYQYHTSLRVCVDGSLLLGLWATTALSIALFCLIFVRRKGESDAGFLEMLKKRKLLSSVVIGLGVPVPLLNASAGYSALRLATQGVGFEGQGWLFLSGLSFFGLVVLSLLLFIVIQFVKSAPFKIGIVVCAGVTVFVGSILGPVLVTRSQHARDERLRNNHLAAAQTMRDLNQALEAYKARYEEYPLRLDNLAPPPKGLASDKTHASLYRVPLEIEKVYQFNYLPKDSRGNGHFDAYEIHADQIENNYDDADGTHFYTNNDGDIRWCMMCPRAHADDPIETPGSW